MYAVDIDKVHVTLRDLLVAAMRGEDVVFTQDAQEIAHLVIVNQTPTRRRVFGSAKGMIDIADDFDAPLPDFEEYMS